MSESGILSKRLFIGGLCESVTESELLERFSRFGKVSNVSLKTRVDDSGAPLKSFAHLNLQGDEASIKKCFNTYQNAKWKGSVMKLQYAKENVLERLQREREESASVAIGVPKPEAEKSMPPELVTSAKGVPGTPVPGKKDWVVGKYGRALPVMKLKKSYKIPMVKHDPSKYCHTAKVFKEEGQDSTLEGSCAKFTWEINKPDSEITKKRKGEFPENPSQRKKKPASVGPQSNSVTTERSRLLPPSRDIHNRLTALASEPRESDDLEVVKIGAVIARSGGANLGNRSNKFDSDLDSDTESGPPTVLGQQKSETLSSGNLKLLNRSSENRARMFPDKRNRLNGPSQNDFGVSRSLPDTQHKDDDNFSTNRAGIPEFKGLSMLGLFNSSASSAKSDGRDSGNLSSPKQAKVPSSEDSRPQAGKTSLSNGYAVNKNSPLASSVARTSIPHTSPRESSIVANPVHDVTIATPAPFSAAPARKGFKTSTPNAPSSLATQSIPQTANEAETFRLIPEFKGLGMLSDFNLNDCKKNSTGKAHEIKDNSTVKESLMSNKLLPTPSAKVTQSKNESSIKPNAKALKSVSDLSTCVSNSKPTESVDPKRLKLTAEGREHDDDGDSDSSAGTDEIILRHKERKSSGTGAVSKPGSSIKPVGLTNKSKVSVDTSLAMSEFVSGVDESGVVQNLNGSSSHRSSDDDSHDSDLDSNDFALVAKKLRQKAMQSMQGVTEKVKRRDKEKRDTSHQRERVASLTREAEDVSKQGATDVQTKLLNIAGSKKESVPSSNAADRENKDQKNGGHLSEKDKQRAANEKRLEAMKQQARQREQQQQLMQQALRNVDAAKSNKKRIVFESSDDNSDDEDKNDTSSVKESVPHGGANKEQNQEKSGPALFASSEDDESEDEDYDEVFKSKPQFEGKKGEKLLKLENRFGDKRFKMDAKFADTDSEEEEGDDNNEKDDDSRQAAVTPGQSTEADLTAQLKEEKSSSLRVLESVVGKSTLDRFSEKINRNTKKIIDMNTVRYDPTKMSLSPASAPEKKETAGAAAAKSGRLEPTEDQATDKSQKKEKNSVKIQVAKTEDVDKPSKVGSGEDAMKDHGKGEEREDQQTEKKEKQNVPKKEESDYKSKTSVELSSSLLNLFKAKAEQKEGEENTFSLSQQFGAAGGDDDDDVDDDDDYNFKGHGIFQFEKNGTAVNKPKSEAKAGEADKGVAMEVGDRDGREERTAASNNKAPAVCEGDLSSDQEEDDEEEVDEARLPTPPSNDKSRNGIDEDMLNAGRVDIRFTKDQWHEQWDALRQSIIKIYKKKHKDALKKKRIHGETKRKKEFLKNSRKAGKKNWGAFKKR